MDFMESEYTQSYLEISRKDLRYNAETVIRTVGVPVIGVVKCDGYGVSAAEAAGTWLAAGAKMLAVSEPEEALGLRRAGFTDTDILLLTPAVGAPLLSSLLKENIILTVTSPECARRYARVCTGKSVRVHVAVDTGMGRFGLRWNDWAGFTEIYHTPGLRFEGIFSHFCASFQKSGRLAHTQLARFLALTETLREQGFPVGLRHIANSCAAFRFPESRLDAVRIGSALVGRLPVSTPVALRQVGRLKAMVVDCKLLRRGDTTGYAGLCRLRRDTRVAIVSLGLQSGYGLEGLPQSFRAVDLARNTLRLVRLYRTPPTVQYRGCTLNVVGRIGTQFTLVDAADTEIAPGDYVTAGVDILFPPPHRRFVR